MRKLLAFFFLLFSLLALPSFAETTARVDRDAVAFGDSLTLTIRSTGSDSGSPDLTSLKKNFTIFGTSTRNQYNLINGRSESYREWIISIAPNKRGKVVIPSIQVGNETTDPITITVSNQYKQDNEENSSAASENAIFVRLQAEPGIPYVQQQVLVKVLIYIKDPTGLGKLALQDPKVQDADIKQISDEYHYQSQFKGTTYQVIAKHYLLTPKKPGPLTITDTVLSGQMIEASPRGHQQFGSFFNDPFYGGQKIKPFQRVAPDLTLDVQKIPNHISATDWLPATAVELTSRWSQKNPVFTVGEPLTRTITIKARGQVAANIPELKITADKDFKLYPDPAKLNDTPNNTELNGTREQTVAYVPTKAGNYTLPPLAIRWFNVTSKQVEEAILPAERITVHAGAAVAQPTPPQLQPDSKPAEPTITPVQTTIPTTTADEPANTLPWLISMLLFVGWAITLFLLIKKKKSQDTSSPDTKFHEQHYRKLSQLKKACLSNDAVTISQALVSFAKIRFNDESIRGVQHINAHIHDNTLHALLVDLERDLYAKEKANLDGRLIYDRLIKVLKEADIAKPSVSKHRLPPLYPE